ncbi:MAG TPA: 50S ribosomal protein L18 [Rhabdochlamydiaceae bacterium]|nr:50S ribosomal protein L18 [Rhabdochlamydiaceae bacterium]
MENYLKKRNRRRVRRQHHTRNQVRGTSEKPRLSVFKSNLHLSAQLIDDESGATLAHFGTLSKELKTKKLGKKSKEAAKLIGKLLGEKAKEKQLEKAVFDRSYYKYHGLIAAIADGAREAGLKF